jgi:hypothetical protein
MKRLLLSVIGGFIIPFLYGITSGPLSTYTDNFTIQFWLNLPIGWPRVLYFYVTGPFAQHQLAENEAAFLIYIIGCDVLLYSLVTYGLLWMLTILRRKKDEYDAPPAPNF